MAEINRLVVEVDVSQLSRATAALETYVEAARKAAAAIKKVKDESTATENKRAAVPPVIPVTDSGLLARTKEVVDSINRAKKESIKIERDLHREQNRRSDAMVQSTQKAADAVAKEIALVKKLQDAYRKAPKGSREKSDYGSLLSNYYNLQGISLADKNTGSPLPTPLFSEAAIETLNRYKKGIDVSDKALKTHHQTLRGFISDLRNADTPFGAFLRFGTELYIAIRAVQTIYRVVSSGISAVIQASTQLESLSRALGALSGSVANGQIITGFIGELSRTLPVSSAALGEASKALMGYGFSMTEVVDILPTLAQITQNNADKMEGLAIVYGQVRSQGRAYYDDVRQFVTAGIPVVETLAKVLKIPVEDVRKAVREGKADIEVFDRALRMLTEDGGQFHKRLQAELDTTRGKVTMLKNDWATFLQVVGNSKIPKAFVGFVDYMVKGYTETVFNSQLDFILGKVRSKNPETKAKGNEELTKLVEMYPDMAYAALQRTQSAMDSMVRYDTSIAMAQLRGEKPDYSKIYNNPQYQQWALFADLMGKELRRVQTLRTPMGGTGTATPNEADEALANFTKQMEGEARYLATLKTQATKADYAKAVTSTAGTRESLYESTFKQIASQPNSAPVIAALNAEYQKYLKIFGPAAKEKKEKKPVEVDIMEDFVKKLRGLTMRLGEDDDYAKFVEARTSLIDSTTQRAFEEGFGQDSALYKKIVSTGMALSDAISASEKRYLATMAPGRNVVTAFGAMERGTARWERYAGYDYGPYADLRKSMVDTLTAAVTDANLTGNIDDALQKGNSMWSETLTELMRRGASEADITAIRDVFVDVMKPVENATYLVRAMQNPTYTDSYTGRFGWQRTGGTQTAEDTNALIALKDSATQWEAIFGQPIKDFTIAVSKFGVQIAMLGKELSFEELQTAYRQALVSVDVATKELETAQGAYRKTQVTTINGMTREQVAKELYDFSVGRIASDSNTPEEVDWYKTPELAYEQARISKSPAAQKYFSGMGDFAQLANAIFLDDPTVSISKLHRYANDTRLNDFVDSQTGKVDVRRLNRRGKTVIDELAFELTKEYYEGAGAIYDGVINKELPANNTDGYSIHTLSKPIIGRYNRLDAMPREAPSLLTSERPATFTQAMKNRYEMLVNADKEFAKVDSTSTSQEVTLAQRNLIMAQANAQALGEAAKSVPLWREMEKIQGKIVAQEEIRGKNAAAWTPNLQDELQGLYKELYAVEKISQLWTNISKLSLDALYSSFMDVASSIGTLIATGEGNPLETFAKSILNALPSILLAGAKSAFEIPGGKGFLLGMGLLIAAGVSGISAAYANSSSSSSSSTSTHGTFYEDAMGGAYDQYGRVAAFANGGVFTNKIVSKPTFFRHGGGFGVMGEAGEEGILPLTRVNGKLGVHATGGGSPTTVFQIIDQRSSGADIETREEQRADGTKLITAVIRDAVRKTIASGEQDTAFKRFGLVPVGARRM